MLSKTLYVSASRVLPEASIVRIGINGLTQSSIQPLHGCPLYRTIVGVPQAPYIIYIYMHIFIFIYICIYICIYRYGSGLYCLCRSPPMALRPPPCPLDEYGVLSRRQWLGSVKLTAIHQALIGSPINWGPNNRMFTFSVPHSTS